MYDPNEYKIGYVEDNIFVVTDNKYGIIYFKGTLSDCYAFIQLIKDGHMTEEYYLRKMSLL